MRHSFFAEVIKLKLMKYGRIGKSPLIKAIGIQKNHKEITYTETQELDHAASGCFCCPNYKNIEFYDYMPAEIQDTAKKCCESCPYAVYKTVTHEQVRYINEKNLFGNAPRLKAIALKLLVIYHFAYPDERGFVHGLSPKELSQLLGCTVRSIKNANETLQKYGYIMYSTDGSSKNRFQICLTEYASYSLPADKGGRGYATFNQECLQELIKIKDLNQLRIYLRAAIDIDTNRNSENELIISQDYDTLRRFLPGYCKPGIIQRALSAFSDLFDVRYDNERIYLKMNPAYHGRREYETSNQKNASLLQDYISKLDETMNRINAAVLSHEPVSDDDVQQLADKGILSRMKTPNGNNLYVTFKLTSADYKDLGVLCTTYSLEAVQNCIGYVYENYCSKFKVERIGALIRTILKEKFEKQNLALLFTAA